jgi:hypothetical protein
LKKVSVKTNRKILSAVKLDVIDLAGSTVQCILKNEDKIKDENGKK